MLTSSNRPFVSTMLAPAMPQIVDEFQEYSALFQTFTISIFILGTGFGCLWLPPLSEIYGRVLIYHWTNILFLLCNIICAISKNFTTLLTARFFCGFAGAAALTIGPGTIADLVQAQQRGKALSWWSVGTILGPLCGPLFGGYVAETLGWRWIFWITSIAIFLLTVILFIALRESHPRVIFERRVAESPDFSCNLSVAPGLGKRVRPWTVLRSSIQRPLKLLFLYPIVSCLCLYVSTLYGVLYLLFSTYAFVFPEVYLFSTFQTGLVFVPGAIATLLGLIYTGCLSDRLLVKRVSLRTAVTPEDRLSNLLSIPGSLCFPIGLFIYGFSSHNQCHWSIPLLGTSITGFGSILVFISVQLYLVDAFADYAASVTGANAFLRSMVGGLVPLCGLRLYEKLGLAWGNHLLGFIALALSPSLLFLPIYGARLRVVSFAKDNL